MREHLTALDKEFAFQTSARFDLLAGDHVPHTALGARDVEGTVVRAIEKGEGIIAITGRMGSGKSSVIAAVAGMLDEGFLPLRVSVVGVEAGHPPAFARHAIQEISQLPDTHLTNHERLALARATAQQSKRTRSRELRAGFGVTAGAVMTANVGDIKTVAKDELVHATDSAAVLSGLQRLYLVQRRIDSARVPATVESIFEPEAFRLVVACYAESVIDRRAGDMRRTLAVVRNALELAVEEPGAGRVSTGHMQEAMARNPLAPGSALAISEDLRVLSNPYR